MATEIGELVWKINGDTRNFDKNLRKSETGLKKFGGAIKTFATGAAVAFAATGIVKLGKSFVLAASEAEETQNKFDVVFRGIAEGAAAVDELSESYGLSREASQGLLSDTADLLQGFGIAKEESLALSTEVQQLSVDLASFTNFAGGAEGASQALTKALLGERESVKSLGIAITEAELKRFAEEQGLIYNELDKGEKAFLTFDLAVKQSQNAIGDFERSQESFANQMRIAGANVQDLSVSLGQDLLPIATEAVQVFNNLIARIIEAREETKAYLGAETAVAEGTATFAQQLEVAQKRLVDLRVSLQRSRDLNVANTDVLEKQIETQLGIIRVLGTRASQEEIAAQAVKEREEAEAQADEDRLKREERYLEYLAEQARLTEQNKQVILARYAAEDIAREEAAEALRIQFEYEQAIAEFARTEAQAEDERHLKKMQNIQDELALYSRYAGNVSTIFSNLIQSQTAGDEELTEKKKKSLLALYRIQQAASIAQIGIDAGAAIFRQYRDLPLALAIPASFLVGAVALTQATVVASTPPPFEDGGIVPGTSFTGDNVDARVNSGEMVLTREQQAQLFAQANGGSSESGGDTVLVLDSEILSRWIQDQINSRNIVIPGGSVV